MALASTQILAPERDTLSAFFAAADRRFAELGLDATLRWSWDGLREFWEACGYPFFEGYTDRANPSGFWLDIRKDGRTIATGGGFQIVLVTDLREHLEAVGLTADPLDVWEVEGGARTVCRAVTDRAIFTGAISVAPEFRKSELSRALVEELIPPTIRAAGRARWAAPHHFYFTKDGRKVEKRFRAEGLTRRVNWYRKPEGVSKEEREDRSNWTLINHHSLGYSSPAFVLERCREAMRL
ncbi:hypothetical protein [Nisaea sp.]|uniref:hypothetical protein n=1 Tax=Nisaea sp. TaxID=2024842 RepID=UPI00329A70BD